MEILPDALLVDLFAKDTIEDEELPALRRVDREVRRGGNVRYLALEALGHQFEAGVVWSQGRADSNGCSKRPKISNSLQDLKKSQTATD